MSGNTRVSAEGDLEFRIDRSKADAGLADLTGWRSNNKKTEGLSARCARRLKLSGHSGFQTQRGTIAGHGVTASELLACAEESQSDLIAIGSMRHERLERWILGSVTTEVIRDGRCSVLVIPPGDA